MSESLLGKVIAAAESLTQTVESQVSKINDALASAQGAFDAFIGSDFDTRANAALERKIFIDPINGDDSASGLNEATAIKTSSRLNDIAKVRYQRLEIRIADGSTFDLTHYIFAHDSINVESFENSLARPVIRQGASNYAALVAGNVMFKSVNVETYKAKEDEALPQIWQARSMFGYHANLTFNQSNIVINDNQLLHIHDGGSGAAFHRQSISFFKAQLIFSNSRTGVELAQNFIFSRHTAVIDQPLDLFAVNLTVVLNEVHEQLINGIGIPATNISTNIAI